jgi:hypothetical protein
MRKQFEKTSETEHAAVELSDETLDEVTGGDQKAGSSSTSSSSSGKVYLVYTFGTVFTTKVD